MAKTCKALVIRVDYRNHRGVTGPRVFLVTEFIWLGEEGKYGHKGLVIRGYCFHRLNMRDFAASGMDISSLEFIDLPMLVA